MGCLLLGRALEACRGHCVEPRGCEMAEAKISSDRWVLDADLESQKEEQNFKVGRTSK